MTILQDMIKRARQYDDLTNIAEIARRYFAMNAFDGVLTIIGVLMGNWAVGVESPKIVISTGLATCVAMGISGLWGAYLTESAERKRAIAELGRHTLTDLNDTRIGQAARGTAVALALVNGLAQSLAALIILVPFFMVSLFPSIVWTYFAAMALALLTLFSLGVFLGYIAGGNRIIYGGKTVVAGIICIIIVFFLSG